MINRKTAHMPAKKGDFLMTTEQDKSFSTKDVSLQLNVGTSTLRKWAISMEKHGYVFTKNTNQRRAFTEEDITALEYIQQLIQKEHFSLTNAAKVVVTRFKNQAAESETPAVQEESDLAERTAQRYNMLLNEMLRNTMDQNEKLERHEQLLNQITEQISTSDQKSSEREQLLLDTIKRLTEEEKPKKSWWNVASWFR
jgi:DNA-binding transcriptional MerR regulator